MVVSEARDYGTVTVSSGAQAEPAKAVSIAWTDQK